MNETLTETTIAQLIKRGGIYYDVDGGSPQEIVSNIINALPDFPAHKKETLLRAVVEREALISTAIGNGIALPHPRTPLLEDGEKPFVAAAFPRQPCDWKAPDGSKVHTVFLIVSESVKQHLGALTKINFLCMEEKLFAMLVSHAPQEEIIPLIEESEKAWQKR
jgi:PTS system nitrogen regulatory IIA component